MDIIKMKKNIFSFFCFIFLLTFCYSQGNEYISIFNENGEWTEEYIQMIRNISFGTLYDSMNSVGGEISITPNQYGLVHYLITPESINYIWKNTKMEITIYDDFNNKIVWNYRSYFDSKNSKTNTITYLENLNIILDIRKCFMISVINDNGKVYLVTLLNHYLGSVYECNFSLGEIVLLKEQVIPPILISKIEQNEMISQEDGIKQIFKYIIGNQHVVRMDSIVLEDNDFIQTPMIINREALITATSFLIEGKTSYNIDNLKNSKGLPYVPAKGQTFSNVITIESDYFLNYGLIIQNGYISDSKPDLFNNNCRIKTMKLSYPKNDNNDTFEQIVTLKDDTSFQYVPFIWSLIDGCRMVQIQIESVYEGNKYDDVCINYIGLISNTISFIDEK